MLLLQTEYDHANHVSDPTRGLSVETKPSKMKLKSFLQQLRTEKYGSPTVSASVLQELCEGRKAIPSDEDTAFVLYYFIHAESTDPDKQVVRIVVSTWRLLQMMRKSDMVQLDATYKVMWQGYPVMVLGTSDHNQVFHSYGLAVCNTESTEGFPFNFQSLHNFDLE